MKHLIFYDGKCPLCNRAIRFILAADQKKQFYFAPLQGKTAGLKLKDVRLKDPSLDTLVLLQNYESKKETLLIEGKGALRIYWLLGGSYRLIGWLSFLPSFLFDLGYRMVARYRYRLFSKQAPLVHPDRFLP